MNLVRGEQTRKDVLQAAKRLFLTQGYGSTSMRDIAKAAGNLSVGSLYNHFTGKEVIFETLFNDMSPHPLMLAAAETVEGETAPDFIRQFLRKIIPILLEHFDFIAMVQIDAREFGGRNISALLEKYIPPFALLFGKVQTLQGLKPISPVVFLRFMSGSVLGFAITNQFIPAFVRQLLTDEAWLEHFTDFILHGVAAFPEPRTGVTDDHSNA
jgi:AcrR family transcriptional regulator